MKVVNQGLKNEASVFKLDEQEMARLAEGIERAIMKFCDQFDYSPPKLPELKL